MYPNKTEIITKENVLRLGEIIATCAIKAVLHMNNSKTLRKLYNGLLQDRFRKNEINHTFSDGYDLAQTAICFLCGYIGKKLEDDSGIRTRKNGTPVSIERACYRAVAYGINREHRSGLRKVYLDDLYGLETAAPLESEIEEQDNSAVDEKISQMNLTTVQRDTLTYRMNGNTLDQIGNIYNVTMSAICYRLKTIRKVYINHFGSL